MRSALEGPIIGTLAGGIARDFNNILGAILGNVALAQIDLPAGHPALNRRVQIAMGGARARNLAEQILTFSRHEPPVLKAQLLNAIVRETETMLRKQHTLEDLGTVAEQALATRHWPRATT